MDPSFVDYLKISVHDGYRSEGISEKIINELVQASLRVNYGQNISVHEFVGKIIYNVWINLGYLPYLNLKIDLTF